MYFVVQKYPVIKCLPCSLFCRVVLSVGHTARSGLASVMEFGSVSSVRVNIEVWAFI